MVTEGNIFKGNLMKLHEYIICTLLLLLFFLLIVIGISVTKHLRYRFHTLLWRDWYTNLVTLGLPPTEKQLVVSLRNKTHNYQQRCCRWVATDTPPTDFVRNHITACQQYHIAAVRIYLAQL